MPKENIKKDDLNIQNQTWVYIVNSSPEYERMFNERGWYITSDLSLCDLVQFTGGSDVNPELYGEKKHRRTHISKERDRVDMLVYAAALRLDTPMVGICRGGQFLNVMNGGKMCQHIEGHCKEHNISYMNVDEEPVQVKVSSTHHQHMLHETQMGEVIASSVGNLAPKGVEEIVYYAYTNCLCFQPHPEFLGYEKCQNLYFDLIEEHLLSAD